MNKTILIAGGASIASLAAGGAAGYFFAKKKFYANLDELIEVEVSAVKKYMSVQVMEARNKPATIEEVLTSEEEIDEEPSDEELLLAEQGKAALINYQGIGLKPDEKRIVENNVFGSANSSTKKPLPPRDPSGKFAPAQAVPEERTPDDPYIIEMDDFLTNDSGYDQVNYLYFAEEKTVLDYDQESVEIGLLGEANLTLFPEMPVGVPRILCIRNEKMATDYEIKLMEESLTEFMGLGDGEDDIETGDLHLQH